MQLLSRIAAAALIGGMAAACSAETTRLAGNPFSNPFGSGSEPTMTGALPDAAPTPAVRSQPLPAPQAAPRVTAAPLYNQPAALPRAGVAASTPRPVMAAPRGGPAGWSAQGGSTVTVGAGEGLTTLATRYGVPPQAILSANGLSSAAQVTEGRSVVIPVYNAVGAPVAQAAPATPRPVAPPKARAAETPRPAAKTAKVEADDADEAPKKHVRPGQKTAQAVAKPEPKPAAQPQKLAKAKPEADDDEDDAPVKARVRPGAPTAKADVKADAKTALKPVAKPAQPAPKVAKVEADDEEDETPKTRVRPGQKTVAKPAPAKVETAAVKPAKTETVAAAKPAPVKVEAAPKPAPVKVARVEAPAAQPAEAPKPAPQKVAAPKPEPVKAEPVRTAALPAPKAEPAKPAPAAPKQEVAAAPPPAVAPAAKEPAETGAVPQSPSADFRWPARGRVITGYTGGGGNEGINIAVPEGTPVKAAESGTVAYAGEEVKGYGKLVLIKHDNGYVSAYAHNGVLSVKRGEKVKRGQVVATSGQTGNVTSPQLHFELRKGATPIDPVPYLTN